MKFCEKCGYGLDDNGVCMICLSNSADEPARESVGLSELLCGDLVVVSHWSDFDYPNDPVFLGILTKIENGYYYINDEIRGFVYCKFVYRKAT